MSTYSDALAAAQQLAARLQARGVRTSIELQVGVSTSGWLGGRKYAEMSHHTVSRRSMGDTPCLALVKRGRPDVPGPLCNGYGGFDEVYRIITMGWANHPGAGGPMTVAGFTIPYNNARPYVWGTEYEGGLDEADWTPSFRAFMGRSNAAILDWLQRPLEAHVEHATWAPTRKIDRLRYTAARGQAEIVAATSTPPPPEDDMFSDADRAKLDETLAAAQAAIAAANAATAEARRATVAAERATQAAQAATDQAGAAMRESKAGRNDSRAGTSMVLGAIDDVAARAPRVNTAQYGKITAASYGELADQAVAQGIDYLRLSGQLVGVQVPPLGPVELAQVAAAAREGAAEGGATGGTFTLTRES